MIVLLIFDDTDQCFLLGAESQKCVKRKKVETKVGNKNPNRKKYRSPEAQYLATMGFAREARTAESEHLYAKGELWSAPRYNESGDREKTDPVTRIDGARLYKYWIETEMLIIRVDVNDPKFRDVWIEARVTMNQIRSFIQQCDVEEFPIKKIQASGLIFNGTGFRNTGPLGFGNTINDANLVGYNSRTKKLLIKITHLSLPEPRPWVSITVSMPKLQCFIRRQSAKQVKRVVRQTSAGKQKLRKRIAGGGLRLLPDKKSCT